MTYILITLFAAMAAGSVVFNCMFYGSWREVHVHRCGHVDPFMWSIVAESDKGVCSRCGETKNWEAKIGRSVMPFLWEFKP